MCLSLPGPMNLIRPKMQAARRLTLAKKEEEDEEHVIFFGNFRWKMENLGMKWVTNFTLKYFNSEQHWSTLDDFFVSVESNGISYLGQNWSTSTTIYRFQFLGNFGTLILGCKAIHCTYSWTRLEAHPCGEESMPGGGRLATSSLWQ